MVVLHFARREEKIHETEAPINLARVLGGRDLLDWIAKHGGEPMRMAQPEFARFVQSESESATRLTNAGAIK